ncbi:hypothetical protein ACFX12_030146 [Malus domestica]
MRKLSAEGGGARTLPFGSEVRGEKWKTRGEQYGGVSTGQLRKGEETDTSRRLAQEGGVTESWKTEGRESRKLP